MPDSGPSMCLELLPDAYIFIQNNSCFISFNIIVCFVPKKLDVEL